MRPSVREYLNNKALWDNYVGQRAFITDQNQTIFDNFEFGLSTLADAGCGPIAIYNTMIATGNSANLADIVYRTELVGGLSLGGTAGTSPSAIGKVLDSYGINNQAYSTFYQLEQNMQDGDVAIMLIVNKNTVSSGLYYYATQKNGDNYNVYNQNATGEKTHLAGTMNNGGFVYGYIIH